MDDKAVEQKQAATSATKTVPIPSLGSVPVAMLLFAFCLLLRREKAWQIKASPVVVIIVIGAQAE